MSKKKKTIIRAVLTLLGTTALFAPADRSMAQPSARHNVTVQVNAITAVQVTSGTVNLNITNAVVVAGQDEMTVTDQSTNLLWGVNSSGRKVTVSTNLASPRYTLKILAMNPTQGMAAPEVTLSSAPQDLLLGIGRSSGTCTLRYTGTALASQGTGNDIHVITFTVQAQ